MAIFKIEVDDPGADTRAIETHWIARACQLASHACRSGVGTKFEGEIKDAGKVLGRWSYTPAAKA
jgi:hypothetical protein